MAISEEVCESFIADVVAALGDEVLQFSAALGQSLDAVAGNQIAPGDVLKLNILISEVFELLTNI
jgi:hypothetical protein